MVIKLKSNRWSDEAEDYLELGKGLGDHITKLHREDSLRHRLDTVRFSVVGHLTMRLSRVRQIFTRNRKVN